MYRNHDLFNNVTEEDRSITTLLPKANLARLVMVHWDDSGAGEPTSDCRSSDASSGYITETCLQQWDEVVKWSAGEAGMWTTLTLRATLAAGDGGAGKTVFTNTTMRAQMISMWAFIAQRYANVSNIAGYEVMSEPRIDDEAAIHSFHEDACAAVWKADAKAVCFIGPGAFYNKDNLGPGYLIKGGGAVMYTANFFEPNHWVSGQNKNIAYGQTVGCCDATKKTSCGGASGCSKQVTLDKQWLSQQLDVALSFGTKYGVPVYLDQWGVHADSGGGDAVRTQYLTDVLDLFDKGGAHWAYWDWRQGGGQPGDYQVSGLQV
jgi:aryl-phospho-beta-D-glucosidase BglC (GH1 family)